MLRQLSRDVSGLHFDDSITTIGLRRLWDGRRDILQLVPVQLVGMQAAWLNGAQGMVEGFKDPATQVQSPPLLLSLKHHFFALPHTRPTPLLSSASPYASSAPTTWLRERLLPKWCERSWCAPTQRDWSASCWRRFWFLSKLWRPVDGSTSRASCR